MAEVGHLLKINKKLENILRSRKRKIDGCGGGINCVNNYIDLVNMVGYIISQEVTQHCLAIEIKKRIMTPLPA